MPYSYKPNEELGPLPHDTELEQNFLSLLFQSPSEEAVGQDLFNKTCSWAINNISEDDFYREPHKLIFSAIKNSYHIVMRSDIVSIKHYLRINNLLTQAGGDEYIDSIAGLQAMSGISKAKHYANAIKKLARFRELYIASGEIQNEIAGLHGDISETYDKLSQRITSAIKLSDEARELEPIKDVSGGVISWIEEERRKEAGIYGLRCGIPTIDNALGGFYNQKLVLIKGQTKHGKTAFAGQIIFKSAIDLGHDNGELLVFCLEGTKQAFLRRFVSWVTLLDNRLFKVGGNNATEYQAAQIKRAYDLLPKLPMRITDEIKSIGKIEAEIRNAAMRGKVAGVLIDYAQLINGGEGVNQERQLANIAERLQSLANEINTAILLPSQVTIRNDGSITEKGATALRDNCTLCLHVERGEPKQQQYEKLTSPRMNVICEAARDDAPFGLVPCRFEGSCYRIYELTGGQTLNERDKTIEEPHAKYGHL